MRLNKYLSDNGVCSRREADRLIEAGKVLVDGNIAQMGQQVTDDSEVIVNGKKVEKNHRKILLALNKPIGIECTTSKAVKENIVDFINLSDRVYPVGRLDKESEGLILMTNDGEIVNKILKASEYHQKEYIVRVNKDITDDFLKKMRNGVHITDKRNGEVILDEVTRKCDVEKIDDRTFKIILTQGLNRQIRRMCKALGYRVLNLKRIRIMNIRLGGLKTGSYRIIEGEELGELKKLLEIK